MPSSRDKKKKAARTSSSAVSVAEASVAAASFVAASVTAADPLDNSLVFESPPPRPPTPAAVGVVDEDDEDDGATTATAAARAEDDLWNLTYCAPAGSRKERRRSHAVISQAVEKLLSNLTVVAELAVGDKLACMPSGDLLIHRPTHLAPLWRLLGRTNRWQAVEQIRDLLGTAEGMIEAGQSGNNQRLREALIAASHGVRNLQRTYVDDITIRSRLEVLAQRIELRYDIDAITFDK